MRLSFTLVAFFVLDCTPRHQAQAPIAGPELGVSTAPGPRVPLTVAADAGNQIVSSGQLSGPLTRQIRSGAPPAPAPPPPPAPDAQLGVASPPPQNP